MERWRLIRDSVSKKRTRTKILHAYNAGVQTGLGYAIADIIKLIRQQQPNVRGQAGRAKRVQHAIERRPRPCLHRAC